MWPVESTIESLSGLTCRTRRIQPSSLLGTDDGASRFGELGIGTNEGIDRFTRNILFDEKMDGTAHMAVGRAYDPTVGENREVNQSAIHIDLLKDMSAGTLELDGEVVQEGGEFVWDG